MTHPVKDAAKAIVCLAGAVLRGSGKVCVGVVDAALVCSAVGALRRKKMRGVVKRSVKSAMEAVGNMVNNIIRGLDEEKKSFGEVLVCCFIVLHSIFSGCCVHNCFSILALSLLESCLVLLHALYDLFSFVHLALGH